jgi:hypothetical protein
MTFIPSESNIQVFRALMYTKEALGEDFIFVPDANGRFYNSNQNISKVVNAEQTTNKGLALGYAGLDSAGKVPISQIPDSVIGALSYQGTWNADTNIPALTSSVGTKGHYYVVNVPGSTNLNGVTDWKVGDWAVYNGTAWEQIDNTDDVVSVNGLTGAVVLTKAILGLGNVPDVDATNATNISSGTLNALRLPTAAVQLTSTQTLTNKTLGTGSRIALGSDAEGDLYYRNAAGNLVRLPRGTAGQVLGMAGNIPAWQAGAGVTLSGSVAIPEAGASWSGNTNYPVNATVSGAAVGDVVVINVSAPLFAAFEAAGVSPQFYGWVSATNTVRIIGRVSSFVNIPAGVQYTIRVLK